jgi:hypothetical protein
MPLVVAEPAAVGLADKRDLDLVVAVEVGDDGLLEAGARVVRGELELDGAVVAGEHVEVDLVGVDDVGHAVALEVVDAAAGDRRGGVLGGGGPQRGAVGVEHGVFAARGDADLGQAVAVEVRDRGRAAAAAGDGDVPHDGAVGVPLGADACRWDDDDLGLAVELEVDDGGVAVGRGH